MSARPELLHEPELATMRHELTTWSRWAPFLLDDLAEDACTNDDRRTIEAVFERLDDLERTPATSIAAIDRLLHGLEDPDPGRRAFADSAAMQGCYARRSVMADALSVLVAVHEADDARRGIGDWWVRSAVTHGTSVERLREVSTVVRAARPLARRWYRARGVVLGTQYSDRRVSAHLLGTTLAAEVDAVVAALAAHLPTLARELDAVRPAVRAGGSNEMTVSSSGELVVGVEFRPTARGRLMVAHEVAHGAHALAAQAAGAAEPPSTLAAETIAAWAALGCGRRWAAGQRDWLVALVDHVIDELFVSSVVSDVEDELHRRVRAGEPCDAPALDAVWMHSLRELVGDTVAVPPSAAAGWARLRTLAVEPGAAVVYTWATMLALAVDEPALVADLARRGPVDADELPALLGLASDWTADAVGELERLVDLAIRALEGD